MNTGTTIKGLYRLISTDAKGQTWQRLKTGKTFRVSDRLIERCKRATALVVHRNGPIGISYTSAIEAVVVARLNLTRTPEGCWIHPTN